MASTGGDDDEYDPWFDEVTLGINKEPVAPAAAAGEAGPPAKVPFKQCASFLKQKKHLHRDSDRILRGCPNPLKFPMCFCRGSSFSVLSCPVSAAGPRQEC